MLRIDEKDDEQRLHTSTHTNPEVQAMERVLNDARGKGNYIPNQHRHCRVSRSGQAGAFIDSICVVRLSCIGRESESEREKERGGKGKSKPDPRRGLA